MAASISQQNSVDGPLRKDTSKASKKGKGKETVPKPVPTTIHSASLEGNPWDHDTPWNWTSLTDPSSSRIPPVFTKDGSYFFSLVGSSVKIHSAATGLIVSTLTAPTSTEQFDRSDVLTSAVLNPQNSYQLITGTLDGRILIWDFVNATLLQTIDLGQSIHYMCAHEQFKGSVFVAVSSQNTKPGVNDNNGVVLRISLKPSEHTSRPVEIQAVGKTRFPTGLAVSPNGAWLVATAAHKVYIAKTTSLSTGFTKYVSTDRLTCLAFHPFEEYFATGDEKGVVRLWYCLNDNLAVNVRGVEKRTQTRPLHWHAHAVSSVAFTQNGAYLLSGGEESVLVIWQLHTGKKEFIPRVGAPIGTVSVSRSSNGEEDYLLGLTDATYTFISSSSLKITRSYSRIKFDPASPGSSSSTSKLPLVPIAVQPLNSTLLLPSSHPSSLQIYSPSSSTLLSELEVSPSNRISRRDEKPLIPSRVERTTVSSSGLWMATVDSREGDAGFRPEVYLKIWSWVSKEETWTLNTRIDRPHGAEKVSDVCFDPSPQELGGAMLISTGEDGRIKVWQLRRYAGSEAGTWIAHATLTFRSEIPTSVSWSSDSSLFAVTVGSHIAVYDASTTAVCQILTAPGSQWLRSSHFLGLRGRHLLGAGQNTMVVWDLIENQVAWQCASPIQIDKVISHPKDDTFAVIHSPSIKDDRQETKFSVFRSSSSIPSAVRSIPFPLRNVIFASFRSSAGFSLVGVTHGWRVVMIGDSVQSFTDDARSARTLQTVNQPQSRTLFQDIFGVSAFGSTTVDYPEATSLQRKNAESHSIFEVPAFAMPSLDTFFDPIIESFLTIRKPASEVEVHVEHADEDDEMMDEDDEIHTTNTSPARVPNPGELEAFTKLFRIHCRTGGTMLSVTKTNGKVNGVVPHVNGSSRHSTTMPTPLPPVTQPPPASTSPAMSGKKRKKSSS